MTKKPGKQLKRSFEFMALIIVSGLFVAAMANTWVYTSKVRQSLAAGDTVMTGSSQALVDLEKIRAVVNSELDNGRTFFLLGSKSFYDERKKDRDALSESLSVFEKQYTLSQIPEIVKRMRALDGENQEVFDQGMKFREKNTESKIVGQFYQSKLKKISTEYNEFLDQIVGLETAAISQARARSEDTAHVAEMRIFKGVLRLIVSVSFLFLAMSLLLVRMLLERTKKLSERNRLYDEAKNALQARDEVISLVSHDLREPLVEISRLTNDLTGESADLIKNQLTLLNGVVSDITDQAKSGTETMILRMDQQGINDVLDDARYLLQPLAKQHEVHFQIGTTNPPVLAFFDRERVIRVLSNIVGNAIKFGPKHNKITVKVRSDQHSVYISMEDTGGWMPSAQDSGVGFAIAKTIVEAHGGILNFQAHPNGESIVTFSLPRRRPVGAILAKPTVTIKHIPRSGPSLES
jgi:signal transduction histidine kinase